MDTVIHRETPCEDWVTLPQPRNLQKEGGGWGRLPLCLQGERGP